jgi:hypothetical protein
MNVFEKNKRGDAGEKILMLYRMFWVLLIAFIILGSGAFFYEYYVDVRDIEAQVMAKKVMNCFGDEFNLDEFPVIEYSGKLLEYCGFSSEELDRIYILANIFVDGKVVGVLEQGESGVLWVKEIYEKDKTVDEIAKFEPGYFLNSFPMNFIYLDERKQGEVKMEVLIQHEF